MFHLLFTAEIFWSCEQMSVSWNWKGNPFFIWKIQHGMLWKLLFRFKRLWGIKKMKLFIQIFVWPWLSWSKVPTIPNFLQVAELQESMHITGVKAHPLAGRASRAHSYSHISVLFYDKRHYHLVVLVNDFRSDVWALGEIRWSSDMQWSSDMTIYIQF